MHSYKNALIKKLKEEAMPPVEDPRLLPDAPIPDFELKTGTMIKQGGVQKNWKTRFFKAFNKADNYKIEYYVAEGGNAQCSFEKDVYLL